MKFILQRIKALLAGFIMAVPLTVYPQAALKVGDPMPDLTLTELYNTPAKTIRFSALRGKIVILDFWSPNCYSCIMAFPEVDRLQKKFADNISIIAVSPGNLNTVQAFFSKFPRIRKPDIPFVTGDTVLHRLFPHRGVPFHVWIGKDGKVDYLTDDYNLNEENITKLINNVKVEMQEAVTSEYYSSLFKEDYSSHVDFASYLARSPYSKSKVLHLSGEGMNGYTDGGTIVQLYQRLYFEMSNKQDNFFNTWQIDVRLKDTGSYKIPPHLKGTERNGWYEKNEYAYQLIVPKGFKGDIYRYVLEDFKRYFNVHAHVEQRSIRTMVLVRTSNRDKIRSSGGKPENTFKRDDLGFNGAGNERKLQNKSYRQFITSLRSIVEHDLAVPLADETGYNGNVDISFPKEVFEKPSIENVRAALRRYDLDLQERKQNYGVLVIEDQKREN